MTNTSKPRRRPKGAEGPLTNAMVRVLKRANVDGIVSFSSLRGQPSSINAFAASLVRRGLIQVAGRDFIITNAGREAVKGKP